MNSFSTPSILKREAFVCLKCEDMATGTQHNNPEDLNHEVTHHFGITLLNLLQCR
jgi:hypothetical protein